MKNLFFLFLLGLLIGIGVYVFLSQKSNSWIVTQTQEIKWTATQAVNSDNPSQPIVTPKQSNQSPASSF